MQTEKTPRHIEQESSSESAPSTRGLVLGIINNKGGVGKTTTAINLAAALAVKYRVLLVDLDSQCSATYAFGLQSRDLSPNLADLFCNDISLYRILRPTRIEGLDIIPGSMDLIEVQQKLSYRRAPHLRLQSILAPLRKVDDFIVLDCPPSFSIVSGNALFAADGLVVPVVPHYLALKGFDNLLKILRTMREQRQTIASLWGIVLTMVDARSRSVKDALIQIRDHYGALVFGTAIPVNIRLAEAAEASLSIYEHEITSKGAQCYWSVTQELLQRIDSEKVNTEVDPTWLMAPESNLVRTLPPPASLVDLTFPQ